MHSMTLRLLEMNDMDIPYYRFIEDECKLIRSKNNMDELVLKLLSNKISDEEYRQFIEQCLLKSKLNRK